MKRNKIIYDRWLRMLFLSFALLTGGGVGMVWGQNTETERKIQLQYSTEGSYHKHDSVFVETKEIYVVPGQERELFIPELRISIVTDPEKKNNHRYNWYVHWYVKSKNNTKGTINFKQFTTTKDYATLQGGEWSRNESSYTTKSWFVNNTSEDGGLVWSKRLKDNFKDAGGYGMDASTIVYTAPDGYQDGDIVYCDVSTYQDGSLENGVYTEPTLTKRTKYIIKHYNQYKNPDPATYYYPAIRNAKNYDGSGSLDEKNLNRTINFSMPSLPNNYFWKVGESIVQGEYFQYKVENVSDSYKKFHLTTRKDEKNNEISLNLQQTQRIPKEIYDEAQKKGIKDLVVHVQVVSSKAPNAPNDITTYTFSPVEDMGFEIEDNIKDNDSRYPRRNEERYELIGSVDFDLGEPITELTKESDNIANKPFGYFKENQTTYGFWNKDIFPLLRTQWNGDPPYYFATNNQNIYGLFRSASKFNGYIAVNKNSNNWQYRYYFPTLLSADANKFSSREFYDRTYYISTDKNDPANKDQENLQTKYGHFYYVDASNEPGTVVNVPINGTICPNTEITVTAWLADMTRANWIGGSSDYPLAPNLNILFKGKIGEKEEVLHRFTTGDALVDYSKDGSEVSIDNKKYTPKYNAYLMQWQQLYYTFVLEDNVEYEKYYLEIQNNEPHTDGADYAIDDIRIFKTKPDVTLKQVIDPCSEITEYVPFVKFETDYEMLLTNMGLNRDQTTRIQNVNPDQYDETKDPDEKQVMDQLKKYIAQKKEEGNEVDLTKFTKIAYMIYDAKDLTKPLKIKYDGKNETYYRVSYLSTNQKDMEWTGNYKYDPNNPLSTITSTTINIGGLLKTETDYIVRVYGKDVDDLKQIDPEKNTHSIYNISDNGDLCAMKKVFRLPPVKGLLEIKQGETTVKPAEMEQNRTYKLTAHLTVLDANGDPDESATPENPVFYWFFGTESEFYAKTLTLEDNSIISVYDAFTGLDVNADQTMVSRIKNALQSKYGLIDNVSDESIIFSSDKRIILGADKVTLEMGNAGQPLMIYTPSNQNQLNNLDNNRYCSNPHYFELGNVPTIDPGDPDVPDPEDPDDPKDPDPKDPNNPNQPDDFGGKHVRSVRVGLVQIQDMQKNDGTLRIPVHFRKSAEGEKFAKDIKTDITVLKTSDTKYNNSKSVATLEELVDNATTAAWATNYFKIKFTEEAVNNFKEGFWYMVDIPYAVKDKDDKTAYSGSFQLTLKIVPEYVTWVGSAENMHNWNNDGPSHWRRSKNSELYMGTDDEQTGAQVNGTHNEAYTPMRFTKVTIYGKAQKVDNDYNTNGNAYAAYPHLYQLNKQTTGTTGLTNLLDMAPAGMNTEIGAATKNIEYDLLADPDYEKELFGKDMNPDKADGTENHNYACVRFYGNTCDEIYIKPESEILHTECLTYNKAHVDYEMAPNRWYMLASPLKGVVSGDMYLPTGTGTPKVGSYARQETPAFGEVKYDNTNYTRWKPAVYMRGWDKAKATVVRPDGTKPNYGITSSWSNLYNDVDVPFTPGTGFSIGTKTNNFNSNVLFRLPKADTDYTYYGSTENTTGGNETSLTNRDDNGRFVISPDKKGKTPVTEVQATGEMFGNPFMSHLDMKMFFAKNNVNENTYYILDGSTTITTVMGKDYNLSTEEDYNGQFVAPLQSFIVPDLPSATFNTKMIAKAPANGTNIGLRSATAAPAEDPLPQLRITATRDGVRNTAVVAGLVTASDSYVEGEDAALLINEEVAAPQVYTLAGSQMTAINVTPELNEIPVGIHGKDATPVELSFKLSGAMKNVKLVDKQTGKRYDVTDGLTLTVPGNTSGRYFLNGSIATSNEIIAQGRIIFYNSAPGRIDISSVDPLNEVTVYDIAGRALRTLRNLNTPTAFVDHLAPGFYVVRAESGSQAVSDKVEVK